MFGGGERQRTIDTQTARITELEATVRDQSEELTRMRPFAGAAEQMMTEYTALTAQAAADPASLPGDLYAEAESIVRARYRSQIARTAAETIASRRGAAIREEILGADQETIVAEEEARFATEEEPEIRRVTESTARRELTAKTRTRLREERPKQIREEFEAEHGPEIIAAEEDRFAREEEPGLRTQEEQRARADLRGKRRDELRAKVREEAGIRVLALEENRERFRARIETIAETAKRTRAIALDALHAGDVITIELVESFTDDTELPSNQKQIRSVRVVVDNPDEARVHVMGDTWEKGSALERDHAFRSGSILTIGAAIDEEPVEAEESPTDKAAVIRYSVPLKVQHGDQDRTLRSYDVKRVAIDTEEGPFALLDRVQPKSPW